jgi:transposase
MKKISLTADQKEALISRQKKCRDKRECDRIKAVLLYAKDWSLASIADALLLHETTVTRHINDFNTLGKHTSTSGGSSGYLDTEQTKCLITHLCEVTYLHTHQIVAYIKEAFEVEHTVSGLNKWLHQHQICDVFGCYLKDGFSDIADIRCLLMFTTAACQSRHKLLQQLNKTPIFKK